MTRHDDRSRLQDMLDHSREAVAMSVGRCRGDLDHDRTFELALSRLLEIVGEAAARVSIDARARTPEVRWSDIIGLRNRIVHGYREIDRNIVWSIVELDLPPLIRTLERIVDQGSPD